MAKQIQLFFETTDLTPEEVKKATVRAGSQTDQVLQFFKKHRGLRFTPIQVYLQLFKKDKKILLTSVRRSITVLTTAGYLLKHREAQRKEAFGSVNCTWEYNADESKHQPILDKRRRNEKDRDNNDQVPVQQG